MAQPASKLQSGRVQAALYYARKKSREKRKTAQVNPEVTVNPSITGTTTVGSDLTADPGTWSDSPSFTYLWRRDDVAIPNTNSDTYTLTEADLGSEMSVTVTGRIATGSLSATSDKVGPVTEEE